METLETIFKELKADYIHGEEIGESGTPHLQGYVEFQTKVRPIEKIGIKEIHWEKRRGTKEQAIKYCCKDGKIRGTIKIRKPVEDPLKGLTLHPWQQEILEILKTKPDPRKVYWYWDSKGAAGKTSISKHICMNYNAVYCTGKAADVKFAISEYLKEKDMDVCIFDYVRSNENFISYESIEAVKNGIFFSGKFESGQCIFNTPHVIIFANFAPEKEKLSLDRWIINNINKASDESPSSRSSSLSLFA